MQLVMIETNGNQNYIFSSPRLRENIGASAQLVRLKEWTDTALQSAGITDAWTKAHDSANQVMQRTTPTPDDLSPTRFSALWVSRASGKVIFMVDTPDQAKDVIGRVTRTALAQAPGIDVSGVFVDMGDAQQVTEELLKAVHAKASEYALGRTPANSRFSQLPFLARSQDSVLPAAPPLGNFLPDGLKDEAKDDLATAHSLPSRVKRYEAYWSRRALIDRAVGANRGLKPHQDEGRLVRDPTKLADKYDDEAQIRQELMQAFLTGTADTPDAAVEQREGDGELAEAERALDAVEQAFQDRQLTGGTVQEPGGLPKVTRLSKVAVIHIDGNGVGAIMRYLDLAKACVNGDDFQAAVGCQPDDADALRRFVLAVSTQLDSVVTDAFAAAWYDVARWAQKDHQSRQIDFTVVPVVPVILGGDDVTVITSGDYAIPFAASFLNHFEEKTAADPLLKYLHGVQKAATSGDEHPNVTPGPMTAAAGVAVVRRNFPFHIAYELAERLVSRAKNIGKHEAPPCSTLDFHVLFDTTVLDAAEALSSYAAFTTRPFRLVGPMPLHAGTSNPETPAVDGDDDRAAADPPKHEQWEATCRRVACFKGFRDSGDGREAVPFPRTRATRIRKLLSDAAQADTPEQRSALRTQATKHWNDARKETRSDISALLGGPEAMFDLLELAELLPDSYLREVTGMNQPKHKEARP
ncbi:hypothetical protein [Actinomyces ruminis]|uniref:Uncharacterized protein n=1 Tax=Actinomyces ruminis TaxID=1937003 RepID=A0ABX4MBQ8_9ACTO|nr:hypothetical protein [Actinomyces ruminis]PHP52866.1 hypothetical protein BW737_006210 [Actinomyces ruminis]